MSGKHVPDVYLPDANPIRRVTQLYAEQHAPSEAPRHREPDPELVQRLNAISEGMLAGIRAVQYEKEQEKEPDVFDLVIAEFAGAFKNIGDGFANIWKAFTNTPSR